MKTWNLEEEAYLKNAYCNVQINIKEIADKLNRSKKSIDKKARRMNLNRPSKTMIQLSKSLIPLNTIVDLYKEGVSIEKLTIKTGLGATSIRTFLKQNNIKLRGLEQSQRKYNLDFNYFKNIDTHEKAYILGFIAADGYNNEIYHRLAITLHQKDREVLNFIQENLKTDCPIKDIKNRNHASLIITNKTLSKDLKNLGIVQAKSLILKYPNIDKKFDSAFMLGYFDGDGTINISNQNLTQCSFGVIGSKFFIPIFLNKLCKNCNINPTKIYISEKNNSTATIKYKGRQNIKKIYEFLYKSNSTSFCLSRKKEKFISIINYKKD